ncbi:MAG: acyltransferase [Planctomycetaceae bacterium]|nr:acyltransferase [Planctomycetaceae bacterium]
MSGRHENSRLHAFDNVRGLAAVAVVALHSTYAYAIFPLPGLIWPVPLDEPSRIADAAFWAIEGSVMPLFFTLSGYFLARSLARQSSSRVLAGRTRRLLLPMATVGLVVLVVDLHVWVLGLVATDRATVREYRRLKFSPEIQTDLFGPAHLWYIEYLWIICTVVCGCVWLGRRMSRGAEASKSRILPSVASRKGAILTACGFAVFAASVWAILSLAPQIVLGFQHGWLPDPAKLAHAGVFLLFGMLLQRSESLTTITRRLAPMSLAAAAVTLAFLLPRIHDALRNETSSSVSLGLGGLLALFAIAATLGQIGAGTRWLDRERPSLSRLAAASFWIYLVHHPLLGLLEVIARPLPLPALMKCASVFLVTLAVCLWSYERFAAGGLIAGLLDGELPRRALRTPEPTVAPSPAPERRQAA